MANATRLEDLRDAARALDRVVMWNYWQVPDLWLAKERASYWDKFGMPAVRPKYYTVESSEPEISGLADHHLVDQGPGRDERRAIPPEPPTMLSYILKRLLLMVPTLFGALTVTFIVIQFVPGGPVEQLIAEARARARRGAGGGYKARRDSDAKQIEELKKLYGFDKPAHVRFVEMIGNFLRFDLGRSFLQNKDVWTLIKEKLPVSISLGLWTFLLSYLISIPLGVVKAVREGTRFDALTTLLVLIGYAIPGFVLGVLLIVLFAGGTSTTSSRCAASPRTTGPSSAGRRGSPTTSGTWRCR